VACSARVGSAATLLSSPGATTGITTPGIPWSCASCGVDETGRR